MTQIAVFVDFEQEKKSTLEEDAMSTAPVPIALTPVMPVFEIQVSVSNGVITVFPSSAKVPKGFNVIWTCAEGDLCVEFEGATSPVSSRQAWSNWVSQTSLGPFPVAGTVGSQYGYTVGWRSDASQPWIFSQDPVIIVDTPAMPNAYKARSNT